MTERSGASKLALFTAFMKFGGAQKMMAQLSAEFVKHGFSVDMVLMQAEGEYLKLIPPEVRIVDLKKSRMIASLCGLISYLKRERPDVLMVSPVVASVVALLAVRLSGVGTKVIVREAVSLSSELENAPRFSTFRACLRLVPVTYQWAGGFIAISQGVADDLAAFARVPRAKVEVIYNPVLLESYRDALRGEAEHPWLAPGEVPVILGVGRLTVQKDFATLIKAFALVRRQVEARLLIFGDGPERGELERLVAREGLAGEVALPGFTGNPMACMKRSSVFVLSSRYEGFGNVVVEAMASGTPVVSTRCPSGPSEILAEGKFGRLVPVGDAGAMADAIVETLRSRPDTALPEAHAASFRSDVIAERYRAVLSPFFP